MGPFPEVCEQVPCVEVGSWVIAEPMTMLTDYVLAVECLILGGLLLRHALPRGQSATKWWALAMLAFSVSFVSGGSEHGFAYHLGQYTPMWDTALLTTAAGSLGLLAGAGGALLAAGPRRILLGVAAPLALVYMVAELAGYNEFIYLTMYYGPTLLTLVVIGAWRWRTEGNVGAGWTLATATTMLGGAGWQMSQIGLHTHFNHNDIFHVIMMGAFVFAYWAGLAFEDRD